MPSKRKEAAPLAKPLDRVDSLTPLQIENHLGTYQSAIREMTTRRIYFDGYATGIELSRLDSKYYARKFLDPLGLDGDWTVATQRSLTEIVAWIQLRGSTELNKEVKEMAQANSESKCKSVLTRAAKYLAERWEKLSFDTSAEELHGIVQGCMQILCGLYGVNAILASAIVAAWTPFGIYRSKELDMNILGKGHQSNGSWESYAHFYKEAFKALKTLRQKMQSAAQEADRPIESGKEMERLAWSMFHPPKQMSQPQNAAPGSSRPTRKRKSSTSAADLLASSTLKRRRTTGDIFAVLADTMQEIHDQQMSEYPSDAEWPKYLPWEA